MVLISLLVISTAYAGMDFRDMGGFKEPKTLNQIHELGMKMSNNTGLQMIVKKLIEKLLHDKPDKPIDSHAIFAIRERIRWLQMALEIGYDLERTQTKFEPRIPKLMSEKEAIRFGDLLAGYFIFQTLVRDRLDEIEHKLRSPELDGNADALEREMELLGIALLQAKNSEASSPVGSGFISSSVPVKKE